MNKWAGEVMNNKPKEKTRGPVRERPFTAGQHQRGRLYCHDGIQVLNENRMNAFHLSLRAKNGLIVRAKASQSRLAAIW